MDQAIITPAERERLTRYLAASNEQLLKLTQALSPAELDYKPAPDRWSAAENVEHLAVVENIILDRITKALEASADSKRSAWEGKDDVIVQEVESRVKRYQSPELGWPTGRWSHDELFRQFEAARQRTSDFAASTNAALRSYLLPHPFFGEVDCFQWLLMIAAHTVRHRAQIEELMATPDFPRAAATATAS
jgi:uncharacterized damage-inducible protein DinB